MLIKDCIYLFIDVPEICQKFIDHPLFQRLRRIYQLGVVKYVFPTATHTRFEHSIGTMYLAGEVIDVLRKYTKITEKEKELVMLAGLLHDIGHICFSHLAENNILKKIFGYETHEQRSVRFIKEINNELNLLQEQEIEQIANMVLGIIPKNTNKPFLYEIVNNKTSDIDVDKMDYLRRDAYHTRLLEFIPTYIIKNMYVDNISEKHGLHLQIKEKANNDICNMFITRKKMFYDVYYHKTVRKIEKFYTCMMLQLHKKKLLDIQNIHNYDDHFMETYFNLECKELFKQLCYRNLDHECELCINVNCNQLYFHEQGSKKLDNLFISSHSI